MARQPKTEPRHFSGARSGWGYDKCGENVFAPAPRITDTIERLSAESEGVAMLVDQVNAFAQKRYAALSQEKKHWWNDVLADLGVSSDTHSATYTDGKVTITKKPPTPKADDKAAK